MTTPMPTLFAVILLSGAIMTGCGTTEKQTGLSVNESRLREERLRRRVIKYKNEVREDLIKMQSLAKSCQDYDYGLDDSGDPLNPELISKLFEIEEKCPELGKVMSRYSDALVKYLIFYKKFEEAGGDTRGLELDFSPFQEKHYSPPVENSPAPGSQGKTETLSQL